MPKILDYPRGSLKAALELADAVDSLGDGVSTEMAADRLGKKLSGAFSAQVSAATKYGLIESKSHRLSVTGIYRDYRLAYSPQEASAALRTALLMPPIFQAIAARFAGKELPVGHFEKLLMREFGVPADWASRVGGYFVDGARQVGLIGENNRLMTLDLANGDLDGKDEHGGAQQQSDAAPSSQGQIVDLQVPRGTQPLPQLAVSDPSHPESYVVSISGPGINTSIRIADQDDLDILHATLKKVERRLSS